jgi:hypothetical protein
MYGSIRAPLKYLSVRTCTCNTCTYEITNNKTKDAQDYIQDGDHTSRS